MLVKSQVKYIQSLGQKKHRDEAGVFIAEGPKLVAELIVSIPEQVLEVYALANWISEHASLAHNSKIIAVNEEELQKISQLSTANQVLAVVKKMVELPAIDMVGKIILALDTIQDPGNLGTIVRIADWFGIEQIVCSHACADMYNPKTVQSTMGSIARVKFHYTDLAAWLSLQQDIQIYGADLEGQNISKVSRPHEAILVIGNESKGISDEVKARITKRITIPRVGKAESLNAAVATGIILSHWI